MHNSSFDICLCPLFPYGFIGKNNACPRVCPLVAAYKEIHSLPSPPCFHLKLTIAQ